MRAEEGLTVMVSPEVAMTLERDNLVQEYGQSKGRRPEQDFPKYAPWTLERQVRFLKPVMGKARMATAKQAVEAVQPKDPSQHDCQRLINEGELEQYSANGWKFVKQLQSGKIVVED